MSKTPTNVDPHKTAPADEKADASASRSASTPATSAASAPTPAGADTVGSSTDRSDNAQKAEGEASAKPLTQLEAMQDAALKSRQAATDMTVSPTSTTTQKPDAEFRAANTIDVLTANRERMQAEARASGARGSDDASGKRLMSLHDAVSKAQRDLDDAMRRRDTARDEYDRFAESVSTTSVSPERQVADYITAQNATRELLAKKNAAEAKRNAAA